MLPPPVIESLPLLVFTLTREAVISNANAWTQRYFGLPEGSAAVPSHQFVAPEDVARVDCALRKLEPATPNIDIDARLMRHDGQARWHALHLQLAMDDDARAGSSCVSVVAVDVDRCKRACELHQACATRLLSALTAADIGEWEWDLETRQARLSSIACQLYGLDQTQQTVPLEAIWNKVTSDEKERFSKEVSAAIAHGDRLDIEFPVCAIPNVTRWLRMRAHATGPSSMVGVAFDVSSARCITAKLRKSERRYRELARAAGALVWSADARGKLDPLDEEWVSFTGVPYQQLAGHGWLDVVHPADRQMISESWDQALRARAPREASFRMRRHDGDYRFMHVKAVPLFDDNGAFEEWFGTTVDITEQRQTSAVSETRSVRLAVAMQAASIIIVTLDLQRYVFSVETPSSTNHLGKAPPSTTEIPYDVAMARVHAEDRAVIEAGIRRLIEHIDDSMHFEARVTLADGEHWMTGSAALHEADVNYSGAFVVASLSDISERKRLEITLRDADKRKDEFLAMLAHELRNPLAPLRTAVALQQRRTGNDYPDGLIALMDRQISHLTRLVDDLLEVSRITQGRIALKREPLLMGTVVYGAAEAVAAKVNERQQTLTIDIPRETVWVCADATRMAQILVNILNNACKYTPPAGSIAIRVIGYPEDVAVEIEDTGAGIAPDLLPHIFELFSQGERTLDRAEGGLGIGLSLVRKLVEMHRGTVHIDSAGPGQGTAVTLTFPRFYPPEQLAPRGETSVEANRPNAPQRLLRILIVDDNRDAADSLSEICQAEGHRTCVSYEPHEALARAAAFGPNVALLDIGLPEMDGYELARRLRGKGQKIPALVAITGYGQTEDRLKAQSAGFDHHFVKPVSIDALLRVLDSVGHDEAATPSGEGM
jgi:PAS domain S-box-containing protein